MEGKHDVVGAKLRKIFDFLKLELKPFGIKQANWEWEDKCKMYYVLNKGELAKFEVRSGPPVDLVDFVKEFKKKNKNSFIESGRIMAKVKVPNPMLQDHLANAFKSAYLKGKFNKIKNLKIV